MDNTKFSLTEADKYYIEQHPDMDAKTLSKNIGKSLELINQYLLAIEQKKFEDNKKKNKGESPVIKKMTRHKGATALTKEALMASEESQKMKNYSFKPLPGDYGPTKK